MCFGTFSVRTGQLLTILTLWTWKHLQKILTFWTFLPSYRKYLDDNIYPEHILDDPEAYK